MSEILAIPMMSRADIAKMLSIAPRTVRGWEKGGKMPPPDLVVRKTLRWHRSTIMKWIDDMPVDSDN